MQTSTSLGYDFDSHAGGIKSGKVTRCKDCRYYEEAENVIDVLLLDALGEIEIKEVSRLCTYWATDHVTKPDCFCAWAKPRFSIGEEDMERMGKTYGRIYEKAKDGLPTIGYGKYPSESETGS